MKPGDSLLFDATLSGLRVGFFGKGGAGKTFLLQALERDRPPILGVLGEDLAIQDQWLRGARLESRDLELAAARLAEWLEECSQGRGVPATRRSS